MKESKEDRAVPIGRGGFSNVAVVPPLRNPARQNAARKKKQGCFGRDDREENRGVPIGRGGFSNVAVVPPLRNPARQNAARKKKQGCFGPFDFAQGRRDDREKDRGVGSRDTG